MSHKGFVLFCVCFVCIGQASHSASAKGDEKALNTNSTIVCHYCKKKGHKKADCWTKGVYFTLPHRFQVDSTYST